MRTITLFIFLLSLFGAAQAPAGYYSNADGKTGYELKTALKQIITDGYNGQSYSALIGLYQTSDNDEFYDSSQASTILDIYSENPDGADPYNYSFSENCGNVGPEGTCYNREHLFPQGRFNSQEPMRSDAHHVVPTDGQVNGQRGSFPFGEVDNPTYTSQNGSKKGPSVTPGFSGTVFEPIDEFKGDIARSLLYFSTRYEDNFNDSSWDSPDGQNDPRNGTPDQWYEDWYINLLLKWHAQDPVGDREIDRNNEVYKHQNNRNPYIDNPEYVQMIWGNGAEEVAIRGELTGTYVDTNGDNMVNLGDEIEYFYSVTNIGTVTLYNINIAGDKGSFDSSGQLDNLTPGTTSTNPFGILRYDLTQADLDSSCKCVTNQTEFNANTDPTNTGSIVSGISDDPNDIANVDTDNDGQPDDVTVTNLPFQGTGLNADELFISEYVEGTSFNKAIEIANFTGSPVDLSAYSLQKDGNGSGNWQNNTPLSGTLATGQVFVIANSQADQALQDKSDVLAGNGAALDYNGNDPVGLFKNGTLIDIVGTFGAGSNVVFGENKTLVRKPEIANPNVNFNLTAEWNSFPVNTFSDVGRHTYGNTAGEQDELLASVSIYPNPSTGVFYVKGLQESVQVIVYDVAGRKLVQKGLDHNQFFLDKSGIYFVKIQSRTIGRVFKLIVE
ncbi:endonuclease [Nonlabens marinus]|uniref:Endonuclease I n=1 Tax=Nonlabens marinus S1-08 TaxID=1454201 RepID=W8VXP3_9FLAO|nr:endonuclease [Nonlabens marinus]BAO56277.1 endonuclease I [Nonlabens marinus S1-08]